MRADHPLSLDSGQKSQVGRGSFIEFVLPVVWLAPSDAVMALESGSGRASLEAEPAVKQEQEIFSRVRFVRQQAFGGGRPAGQVKDTVEDSRPLKASWGKEQAETLRQNH